MLPVEEEEVESFLAALGIPKHKWPELKMSQHVRQAVRNQNEKKKQGVG